MLICACDVADCTTCVINKRRKPNKTYQIPSWRKREVSLEAEKMAEYERVEVLRLTEDEYATYSKDECEGCAFEDAWCENEAEGLENCIETVGNMVVNYIFKRKSDD